MLSVADKQAVQETEPNITLIKINHTVVNEFHRERERLFKEAVTMT